MNTQQERQRPHTCCAQTKAKSTDHCQHQQRQHAFGGADETHARRNGKVEHRRMKDPQVNQDHTSCHMHSANRNNAPSHIKAPASRNTCAQSRGQALPSHHLLRNALSSTPPTHACAHALAAVGSPGPQHGTLPKNGHGHADTRRLHPLCSRRTTVSARQIPHAATNTWRGKHRRTCVCALTAPGRKPVPKGGPRTGPK